MRILGIETSCDETAAAVVEGDRVLSSVVSSQHELHGRFFGVVPELASRAHQQKIVGVIRRALEEASPGAGLRDLPAVADAVAFTQGPGLAGALLVGKTAAQTLAGLHRLPLIGVHHLEGHLLAREFVRKLEFPLLALIVSGGHTDLVLARGYGNYRVLGRTRDDAAGEAFDKVAKLLRLGYPGGPLIDALSREGDRGAVSFPRPLLPGSWDFSFSGLKTAVLYYAQRHAKRLRDRRWLADTCASFQEAAVETLVEKALAAAERLRVGRIVVAGGVAANSRLRDLLAERGRRRGIETLAPPPALCTDNGAMIARAAAVRLPARRRRGAFRVDPAMPMRSWGRDNYSAPQLKIRPPAGGANSRRPPPGGGRRFRRRGTRVMGRG